MKELLYVCCAPKFQLKLPKQLSEDLHLPCTSHVVDGRVSTQPNDNSQASCRRTPLDNLHRVGVDVQRISRGCQHEVDGLPVGFDTHIRGQTGLRRPGLQARHRFARSGLRQQTSLTASCTRFNACPQHGIKLCALRLRKSKKEL